MPGMRNDQHHDATNGNADERYFCMIFEDMIVAEICRLRRKELNSQDRFSCEGCSKDTLFRHTRTGRLNLCALTD